MTVERSKRSFLSKTVPTKNGILLITSPVGDFNEKDILSHPGYQIYTLNEDATSPTITSIGTMSPVLLTIPSV